MKASEARELANNVDIEAVGLNIFKKILLDIENVAKRGFCQLEITNHFESNIKIVNQYITKLLRENGYKVDTHFKNNFIESEPQFFVEWHETK